MEKRRNEKRTGGRMDRGGRSLIEEEEEDYGDYVTRCICGFKHDDGYMICCDECSVWQHVECMQVDPKNLPENYLCELCEPRPVDKRRAQKIQLKKREDISDAEEANKKRPGHSPLSCPPLSMPTDTRKPSSLLTSTPAQAALAKKKKKRGKLVMGDPKVETLRKSKREKPESVSGVGSPHGGVAEGVAGGGQSSVKKQRRRGTGKTGQLGSSSSIQSLLTAASLLEDDSGQGAGHLGGKATPTRRKSDLWNGDKSPWTDSYETCEQNLYTEPVRAFLMSRMEQLKSEEVVYSREEYMTSVLRPHPQCVLAEVTHKRKGVVLQVPVPQDELVIECKGKISIKQDILADLVTGSRTSSLWKHKPCPFVYLYDKIANLDLCIDSRNYGNLTRFVRRSCCPNAEVRHFFVSSELHFGVYALNNIAPDEEVTLPFDFRYDKCDYPVECGCGQTPSVCLVARGKHPAAVMYKPSGGVTSDEDYHHSSRPAAPPTPLQRSHSHVFLPQDEDSNSSWTSTASSGRKRARHPVGPSPFKGHSSCGASRDGSSDSEVEETEKPRKQSLSREERKTEQVWRVFEKLEASQRRRQLLSEGSHESDPLSSPTPLHPLSSRMLKDRRSSSSSRTKAHIMPGIKMRLSSVSSTDPLSPYDPCEPFSPPTTPGLGPPPADPRSPLLSPTSPSPHFQATPQLHPKYLFSDYALPWKKAILTQWENEQVNGHTPLPRSYWAVNRPLLEHHVTGDMMKPKTRGSLKHRWLRHYTKTCNTHAETSHAVGGEASTAAPGGSDKENIEHPETRLPHKKRVLLRWQGSEVPKSVPSPQPCPPSPPASPPPSDETAEQKDSAHKQNNPKTTPKPASEGGVVSGGGSPLLEEFSDSDEFNQTTPHPRDESAQSTDPQAASPAMHTSSSSRDHTPSDLPEAVPVASSPELERDCARPEKEEVANEPQGSSDLSRDQEEEGSGSMNVSGVSDISSDLMSRGDPTPPAVGPQTPPTLSNETTPTSIPAGVSDISSDNMDMASPSQSADVSTLGSHEAVEGMETESVSPPLVTLTPSQAGSGEGGGPDHAPKMVLTSDPGVGGGVSEDTGVTMGRPPPLDSLGTGGSLAPSSPLSAQNTPSKLSGKRKITFTEYRSRARKPAEKKVSDKAPSSPPPPSTPGTPSFLAHSFFTSPYTSSLQLTAMPGPTLSPTPAPPIHSTTTLDTHFEPVSPEDGDRTPKLGPGDDVSAVVSVVSGVPQSGLMVPLGGGVGGVAPQLPYSVPQSLFSGYSTLHQTPPPSGLVTGYMGSGDGGRWVGLGDQTQDPRNRQQGVAPISSSGLMSLPSAAAAGGGMSLMQAQTLQAGGTGNAVPMSLLQPRTAPGVGTPISLLQGQQYYQQQQAPGHTQQGYLGPAPVSQPPQGRHTLQPPPPGTTNYY